MFWPKFKYNLGRAPNDIIWSHTVEKEETLSDMFDRKMDGPLNPPNWQALTITLNRLYDIIEAPSEEDKDWAKKQLEMIHKSLFVPMWFVEK